MLLIATDEAGYGPKLGPLVIAATAWRFPDGLSDEQLSDAFAPMRNRIDCQGNQVVIDDSKAVYQSGAGLGSLHAAVSSALAYCGHPQAHWSAAMNYLCPQDASSIDKTPWLKPDPTITMLSSDDVAPVLERWRDVSGELVDVQARVITAKAFNRICSQGSNKADLLSQTTLNLVRDVHAKHSDGERDVLVYCDRHGGRRYYASVLQHVFPESWVGVESESTQQSVYQMDVGQQAVKIHFTVKGDSFTPVAMSSIHAKYLRERMMESFNRYFTSLSEKTIKPTAGYPVDADRFLAEIEDRLTEQSIKRDELVRCR